MFSKVVVKLTGIFVFCISATSATPHPVNGHPEEAQNNGDILARAGAYKPYLCEDPFRWVRRECVPVFGPAAWQDVCVWNSYVVIYDYKQGSCPAGSTCLPSSNNHGPFISCISNETGKSLGKRAADPQWGVSTSKRGRTEIGNTQQEFSITIDHDMNQASVAAVFESERHTVNVRIFLFAHQLYLGDDLSFVIAPNNIIVGNVHGRQEKVCNGVKSDTNKARECFPNGKYDFKSGQVIDFTWGMTADQEGKLVYGVMPEASVGV